MTTRRIAALILALVATVTLLYSTVVEAWDPVPVASDSLVRMPGMQPGQVTLEGIDRCFNCHDNYDPVNHVEPGFNWQGSMMAQAARDPLFWTTVTVAAQDSIWVLGTPNATDLCLRCHSPEGWLEGRSDPTNGSLLTGFDFDGVHCAFCHNSVDPFFRATHDGLREGDDWAGYWDETNASDTPSQPAADLTATADWSALQTVTFMNGAPFYDDASQLPVSIEYDEAGGGQFYVDPAGTLRGPFADAVARHNFHFSRFHRSRYFCNTCHDVSNPVPANLGHPNDGTPLPSETLPAYAYGHVERTFSEFMSSAYGLPGGAPGTGFYTPAASWDDPTGFHTDRPGHVIATCQNCHMPNEVGPGCDKHDAPIRPTLVADSEHPNSGQPVHDLTGGNAWVSRLLASGVSGSPNYDAGNAALLGQGLTVLNMDLTSGLGVDPVALLAGATRAEQNLARAATLEEASYDPVTGELALRLVNHTGHKLPSGYPEGRRMFLNVRAYHDDVLLYEVNPYDEAAATLRGLPDGSSSPPLGANEVHIDALVYEQHMSSSLTGEAVTFHFALADGRDKDNRVPPRGFRLDEAARRHALPVWDGADAPDLYDTDELAGGYDQIGLPLVPSANRVVLSLYYQATSREYVEFLVDEVAGTGGTLTEPPPSGEPEAYIIQTDPFFDRLRAWGPTLWNLWWNNRTWPGAAPILMTQVELLVSVPCDPETEVCDGLDNDCDTLTDDEDPDIAAGDPGVTGAYTYWADTDADTCGDPAVPGYFCAATPPMGWVDNSDDGDDTDGACCGNGALESPEVCDGDDFGIGSDLCVDWDAVAWVGGTLTCSAVCDAVDTAACVAPGQQQCWSDEDGDGVTGTPQVILNTQACGDFATDGRPWTATDGGDCNDVATDACAPLEHPGGTEVCDGCDNDCSGSPDDTFPDLGQTCTIGVDLCVSTGTWICAESGLGTVCDAVPATGSDEVCDGRDNDCDEVSDNGFDDPDADGWGSPCDNCRETDNPAQDDGDDDGVGDACDSCPDEGGTVDVDGCPVSDDTGDAGDAGPDMADPEPDMGDPGPDMGDPGPDMGDLGPDMGDLGPDMGEDVEEDVVADAEPDAGEDVEADLVGDAEPDAGETDVSADGETEIYEDGQEGDTDTGPGVDVTQDFAALDSTGGDLVPAEPESSVEETGCGCAAASGGDVGGGLLLLAAAGLARRRRPRAG